MVYERYIKKGGKTYGPYLYKSYKKDGKVITEYLGKGKQKRNFFKNPFDKNYSKFLFLFGFILLAFSVFLILNNFSFTGNVTAEIDKSYISGEQLKGNLLLGLSEKEFIPEDAVVIINNSGSSKSYLLKELIDEESVKGDYYIQGKNISGSGLGYGFSDNIEIYPEVSFVMRVFKGEFEKKSETNEKNQTNETSEINETGLNQSENEINNTELDSTQDTNNTEKTNYTSEDIDKESTKDNQTTDETGSDEKNNEINSDTTENTQTSEEETQKDITGTTEEKTTENQDEINNDKIQETTETTEEENPDTTETTAENSVDNTPEETTAENPDESIQEETEETSKSITGNIITGFASEEDSSENSSLDKDEFYINESVTAEQDFEYELEQGQNAEIVESEKPVELNIDNRTAIVSTNYSETKKGLEKLNINLSELNLTAEKGELSISIYYQDEEIVSLREQIDVKENQTINETQNLTENQTLNETFNQTLNQTEFNISETNFTIHTEADIVINKPAKWKKRVNISNKNFDISVEIPGKSENISVYKIVKTKKDKVSVQETEEDLEAEEEVIEKENSEENQTQEENKTIIEENRTTEELDETNNTEIE